MRVDHTCSTFYLKYNIKILHVRTIEDKENEWQLNYDLQFAIE